MARPDYESVGSSLTNAGLSMMGCGCLITLLTWGGAVVVFLLLAL